MVYNKFETLPEEVEILQDMVLPDPKVIITFNGSGIHNIAGPTPLISLSSNFNRSAVGQLDSIERKITLEGQIVRSASRNFTNVPLPESSGVRGLVSAHEQLKSLFSECSAGTIAIYCDGDKFFEKHNVRVDSIEFSSQNNFTQVADYTVNLSFFESGVHGFAVKNTTDEWSIEPLEDYSYIDFQTTVSKKAEQHNPHLKPFPPDRFLPNTNNQLQIIDVPRYKITRKLSAAGLPITGSSGCADAGVNGSYLEAKRWVASKLVTAFDNINNNNSILNSGLPAFIETPNYSSFTNTYLYNHVRSINYSISEGTYSVTESWLAMPTGIRYTESFDIDIGTDENYVKTVTVKGEVQGLYFKDLSSMVGSGGSGLVPNENNIISIDYDKLLDNDIQRTAPGGGANIPISKNIYQNAMSGFIYEIKPYIYKRASIGVNDNYYSQYWHDPTTTDPRLNSKNNIPGNAPQIRNPTYTKEPQLNIIPISTSESHNIRKGSVGYTYQFNNKANIATGVISSNITIDTTFPNDVFAESFVLGRQLGPVLQDLGTITSAKKSINIEVNVVPPRSLDGYLMDNVNCPLYTGGNIFSTITGIAEALKPYGDKPAHLGFTNSVNDAGKVFVVGNQESWNPIQGKYNLQLSYVYQPCRLGRSFRDT